MEAINSAEKGVKTGDVATLQQRKQLLLQAGNHMTESRNVYDQSKAMMDAKEEKLQVEHQGER